MPGAAVVLSVTAFSIGIAIMMNVFACTIADEKNMWPLMVLFIQLLAPVPLVLFGLTKESSTYEGDLKASVAMGWFMTGVFLMMGLLIPVIMVHEGTMSGMQLGLTLGSQALTYLVMLGYGVYQKKHSDDYGGF